uniref:ATP-dependent Clp protease proteolytic subunit n=1 Tax=Caenorhabditis tropicalis TaxID=1561998 RepID=A0A1I7UYX9_9PELO
MIRRLVTSSVTASRTLSSSVQSRVGIPFVIDNEGKGERTYDIYSRLLRDRIVCLMTPVDDFIASALIAQLLFLQSESGKKPIHMYINSPEGTKIELKRPTVMFPQQFGTLPDESKRIGIKFSNKGTKVFLKPTNRSKAGRDARKATR